MTAQPYSDRVRVRRHHERGDYDMSTIHAVLDAMPMCSVGYTIDGRPYVTPTLQWREGEHVYWHGSSASRMLRPITQQELKATTLMFMPIEEASAKIRTGQPLDDDDDYALPIWGGMLPVRMQVLPSEPAPRNLEGVEMPEHVSAFKFG